ncbi:uncharacterized protein Z520_02666 [Fonsecaea multimorphosa CBS 102226]|uniref:3-hydroxyisobutyrate dehydrogenase n=1 Tax=Fonsecaea multimorphosa CBS 102226 TaxID=1442371 RepID=A0A0D2KWE5_9EURO|nr:uncharacterized protein Z520_02666 [Fonsecaea multimorphosa CBS 102226]KIY01114.1 hypothetical protein Z520_02666 [Fonsecaea multimorphosa CBS 102226]OAL28735.1 hypothetical protein AYO22_02600 [Fonsecaea multimorphosa]
MGNSPRVGVIGLGAMGMGMASTLLREGFDTTGFDVSSSAMEKFKQNGGKGASSPRGVAMTVDILVVVVANSDQTSSVLFDPQTGAVPALPRNAVILLCITASPDYVMGLGGRLREAGRSDIRVIDCPISGGELRAWQGSLSLLCAGEDADIDTCRPVLDALSSRLHVITGGVGAGSRLKLVHQILVGVHIIAANEVMGLCHLACMNLQSVHDQVMGSDSASWLFGQRTSHVIDGEKVPASSLRIIAKDLAMVMNYGDRYKATLPLASIAHQLFLQVQSAGWGVEDDCLVLNAYLLGRGDMETVRKGVDQSQASHEYGLEAGAICDLLLGIHSTIAVEVLRFARGLGLDIANVREVVKDAAGSSVVFDKICGEVIGRDSFSLGKLNNSTTIREKLSRAIHAAARLHYPLFLSAEALQQWYNP